MVYPGASVRFSLDSSGDVVKFISVAKHHKPHCGAICFKSLDFSINKTASASLNDTISTITFPPLMADLQIFSRVVSLKWKQIWGKKEKERKKKHIQVKWNISAEIIAGENKSRILRILVECFLLVIFKLFFCWVFFLRLFKLHDTSASRFFFIYFFFTSFFTGN